MFYFIIIPICVFLVYQIYSLREMRKHDAHLYAFCEIRRDCIELMHVEHRNLSRNDYIALRKLTTALNITINNYKTHKTILFDFRLFSKYLEDLRSFEEKAEKISTSNAKILGILDRLQLATVDAFLAFTPFLKSEIIAKFILSLLSAAALSGVDSIKRYMKSIDEAMHLVDQIRPPGSNGC